MATIGQSLTVPEVNWTRYDDSDSRFSYVGTWSTFSSTITFYNGICHGTNEAGAKVQFNFTGSKLRIIGNHFNNKSTSVDVYIDGVKMGNFSQYASGSVGIYQALEFDVSNLNNSEHYVSIINNAIGEYGGAYVFDAVDIDSNGVLKSYTSISSPTNLAATPGDSQITLNWDAVTGATGYNVKRSLTTGGPYETIATSVPGTSYVDTNVVNGTTYYYVVTAINADGESANSNEASATPQAAPVEGGQGLLRVTMIDSSEREYKLSLSEINGFINWFDRTVGTRTTVHVLNKLTPNSKEYLVFEKIISFEVTTLD